MYQANYMLPCGKIYTWHGIKWLVCCVHVCHRSLWKLWVNAVLVSCEDSEPSPNEFAPRHVTGRVEQGISFSFFVFFFSLLSSVFWEELR